jgi:hypothetical protein
MSPLLHLSALVAPVLSDDLDPKIEENLTPGWVGAIVIVGLMAVTVLLWLSMRRQFRKIRFEDDGTDGTPPGDGVGDRR